MTAQDARNVALYVPARKLKEKIVEINNGIESTAYNGGYSYKTEIENLWQENLKMIYEERGFKVIFSHSFSGPLTFFIIIKW